MTIAPIKPKGVEATLPYEQQRQAAVAANETQAKDSNSDSSRGTVVKLGVAQQLLAIEREQRERIEYFRTLLGEGKLDYSGSDIAEILTSRMDDEVRQLQLERQVEPATASDLLPADSSDATDAADDDEEKEFA